MKILLDECVTKRLIPFLTDHDVSTVSQKKWNGFKNGKLLSNAVNDGFDILITIDKKIRYQQNISDYNLIVVIIDSPSSKVEHLKEYLPDMFKQLDSFKKGNFYLISK